MKSQPGKRVTREELYEAVWTKTVGTLIKEWKTSYLEVNKACRRLQVPRPKPAYWQHIIWGRLVRRTPLRKPTRRIPEEWVFLRPVRLPLRVAVAAARAEFNEEGLKRKRDDRRK